MALYLVGVELERGTARTHRQTMENTPERRTSYRAELRTISGKETSTLVAPDGSAIAIFVAMADAEWVADSLNTSSENVDALGRAAWFISQAQGAIDSAPGRNIGARATGPGGGK